MLYQPREQPAAIRGAHRGFHVVLWMRHHPEHVALVIEDARDRIGRTVEVPLRIEAAVRRGVAEQHPALAFEPREGLLVGDVIALAMRDRHADHLTRIVAARKRRVGTLDPQADLAT